MNRPMLIDESGSNKDELQRLALPCLGWDALHQDQWCELEELHELLWLRLSGHKNFEQEFWPAACEAIKIMEAIGRGEEPKVARGVNGLLATAGPKIMRALRAWRIREEKEKGKKY